MKKSYQNPEILFVHLSDKDVIATSLRTGDAVTDSDYDYQAPERVEWYD